jgi:hypothetical protein
MGLIPVPYAAGRRVWVERLSPHARIVLDHWDTDSKQYVYHDLDDPESGGRITASMLETRFEPADP